MNLPAELGLAMSKALDGVDHRALSDVANEISTAYRAQRRSGSAYLTSDAHRLAYLAVRLPATYAAVLSACSYTADIVGDVPIRSCLDLGAGPGTASWAVAQTWSRIERVTHVERDDDLIRLGKQLAAQGDDRLKNADWQCADLTALETLESHDLVICSYAIGELTEADRDRLVEKAWSAARALLILIEPGTVPGFQRILSARHQLLEAGAHLVAPCPHEDACPMTGVDWCHFAQRLDRSAIHRQIKSVDLGYEDEKYAYVVVARDEVVRPTARVLRHPQKRSGHTHLSLCTIEGIENRTVTRSQKSDWKRVRRTGWGDTW